MDSMTGVKEAADAADWRVETMGAWPGLLKQEGGKGVNGVNKWSDFRSLNFSTPGPKRRQTATLAKTAC